MAGTPVQRQLSVDTDRGPVSALLDVPDGADWLYVLAHGAGAGMRHPFMNAVAARLVGRGIGVFRYQFPYMEAGKRRPDRAPVAESVVRSAVAAAAEAVGGSEGPAPRLLAGGKSFGGRMTSRAAAAEPLPGVRGLVFLGFPLHAAGKPSAERAAHLDDVHIPTLFLQGTRDALASLDLLRPVVDRLDGATLHVVEGGDHSFHVLKRSGRTDEEVLDEIADAIRSWVDTLGPRATRA